MPARFLKQDLQLLDGFDCKRSTPQMRTGASRKEKKEVSSTRPNLSTVSREVNGNALSILVCRRLWHEWLTPGEAPVDRNQCGRERRASILRCFACPEYLGRVSLDEVDMARVLQVAIAVNTRRQDHQFGWPVGSGADKSRGRKIVACMAQRRYFRTGTAVPQSGIYAVTHDAHRLQTQVALLKGERFPRCAKCRGVVRFELVRGMPGLDMVVMGLSIPAALTDLPVFSDDTGRQNR